MIRFDDGPAVGQTLLLYRAPRFLRVVDDGSKWDALDQLDDTPEPNEMIYAYEVHGEVGRCHLYFGGKDRGRSGWYAMANYRFIADRPPTDAVMREYEPWRKWCLSRAMEV